MSTAVIIVLVILGIIVAIMATIGAVFGVASLMRRKQENDLNRYLNSPDCDWERLFSGGGAAADSGGGPAPSTVYYRNRKPAEASGIEMRVYDYSRFPHDIEAEAEGICLSIIDPQNVNGMILNGFGLPLEAIQFGNQLWNDHFLGDVGIMEQMITEKRSALDQMQREIIIGHYSHFM